jgi:hypothetical protein
VADGEDAVVHSVQLRRTAAMVDGVLSDGELSPGDNAVLTARQVGDVVIRGRKAAHITA